MNTSIRKIAGLGILFALSFIFAGGASAQESANLISNPSLETATSTGPVDWSKGRWGVNTVQFTYPVPGYQSERAAQISVTSYTSGDAKWFFKHVPVTPGKTYLFENFYKSDAVSVLTLEYKNADGALTYRLLKILAPSESWKRAAGQFVVPTGVESLTVFHSLSLVGTLTVDNFSLKEIDWLREGMVSLNFDDGYRSTYTHAMPILNSRGLKSTQYILSAKLNVSSTLYINKEEMLALQRDGHEIGGHTRTHASLPNFPESEIRREILVAKDELLAAGATSVTTFAYTFGEYNDLILDIVKSAFEGARTTQRGYNVSEEDIYLLKVQNVRNATTFAEARAWIDQAVEDKTWLVLLFHQVRPDGGGDSFTSTPDFLEQVADYLKSKNVRVVTNAEGIKILKDPSLPRTDVGDTQVSTSTPPTTSTSTPTSTPSSSNNTPAPATPAPASVGVGGGPYMEILRAPSPPVAQAPGTAFVTFIPTAEPAPAAPAVQPPAITSLPERIAPRPVARVSPPRPQAQGGFSEVESTDIEPVEGVVTPGVPSAGEESVAPPTPKPEQSANIFSIFWDAIVNFFQSLFGG